MGTKGEGDYKGQTFNDRMIHGTLTRSTRGRVGNTVVAESSGSSWTYCLDYFIRYLNVASLCCRPETNTISHVNPNEKINRKKLKKERRL